MKLSNDFIRTEIQPLEHLVQVADHGQSLKESLLISKRVWKPTHSTPSETGVTELRRNADSKSLRIALEGHSRR